MAHVVLFHSVLGLRPIERDLAREWEVEGHPVTLPDLYDGQSAETYDGGFALYHAIGHPTVRRRAADAIANAPEVAVLAGVSMGAGLVGESWGDRPRMAGALLIAGATSWTHGLRPGLPVQAHIARPDPFDPEEVFADWAATAPGVALDLRRYDGRGHYFLDPALPDFDADSAATCRAAMRAFLRAL